MDGFWNVEWIGKSNPDDTPTHASGEIWHSSAYFTGEDINTSSCLDASITYEVENVGSAITSPPDSAQRRIVILEQSE